jgi:mevalonate kinase
MRSSISWMKKTIDLSANGKLLLTGEYLVLSGAKALAFPVRFGQSMHVEPSHRQCIRWISKENGSVWFTCDFNPGSMEILSCSDPQTAARLARVLLSAMKINPWFLNSEPGSDITVEANYPLKWGLGSSSTLIGLVASWAGVDKFRLFSLCTTGSGYDMACTDRSSMFFYKLTDGEIDITDAQPGKAIMNHACFAYLGKKQDTSQEVSAFLAGKNFAPSDVRRISELSQQICHSEDPSTLCSLIDEHEEILGRILKKEKAAGHFPGFPGSVKSLGAWGGDFAMFVSLLSNQDIKSWLKQYGLPDIFTFDELKAIM